MQLLITITYSNGFKSDISTEVFETEQETLENAGLIIESQRKYYTSIDGDIQVDTPKHFRADENNMKGNAFEVIVVDEQEVMSKIIDAVKSSIERYGLETMDENGDVTITQVPILKLENKCSYVGDKYYGDGNAYQPISVIERPDGEDMIYDVYMFSIDEHERLRKMGIHPTEPLLFVDSLECIGYNIMSEIYINL